MRFLIEAPGLVEIEIDWSDSKPLLTVRDTGPGFDSLAASPSIDALEENGRGLFLIQTEECRITRFPESGTTLRVLLPSRPV